VERLITDQLTVGTGKDKTTLGFRSVKSKSSMIAAAENRTENFVRNDGRYKSRQPRNLDCRFSRNGQK
jgi:hypothetical protein